jgi:hypothetical protein
LAEVIVDVLPGGDRPPLRSDLAEPGAWHGTVVWRLHDGRSWLEGRLADCGMRGFEYRLFIDGRFICSERFLARQDALKALSDVELHYRRLGLWHAHPGTTAGALTSAGL